MNERRTRREFGKALALLAAAPAVICESVLICRVS